MGKALPSERPGEVAPFDPDVPPVDTAQVPYRLVSEQRRSPTADVPITHYERVFGLTDKLPLAQVEAFLVARLAEARAQLSDAPTGQLISLALFDQLFEDRPERPPVATLRWRDWRDSERELVFFPYSAKPTARADDAAVALGADVIDPAKPTAPPLGAKRAKPAQKGGKKPAKGKPKLSKKASDDDVAPPSRPIKAMAVIDVDEGAATRKKTKANKAKPSKAKAAKAGSAKADVKAPSGDEPKEGTDKRPARKDREPSRSSGDKAKADPSKTERSSRRSIGSRKSIGGVKKSRDTSGKTAGKDSTPRASSSRRSKPGAERRSRRSVGKQAQAAKKDGAADGTSRRSQPSSRKSGLGEKRDAARGRTLKLGSGSKNRHHRSPPPPASEDELLPPEEQAKREAAARDRASGMIPPVSKPGIRVGGEDLITDLFEAMSELHYLDDALQGAGFVLRLALEKLPSEAGLVSLFDIDTREFVVVQQTGGKTSGLLLRLSERSELQRKAMRSTKAIVLSAIEDSSLTDGGKVDPRWEKIGILPRSLICAPVERGGRYLGLIELANPLDGKGFSEADGNALEYIGEQYAEFLSERGVLIDPDEVVASAEAGAE